MFGEPGTEAVIVVDEGLEEHLGRQIDDLLAELAPSG